MEKNKLAKIALTALVLASSSSVQALDFSSNSGTFLAAACGAKCGASKATAYNPSNSDPYNARTNSYQASCSNSQRPAQAGCSNSQRPAQSGCANSQRPAYQAQAGCANSNKTTANTYDPSNSTSYNTNRGYNTTSGYSDSSDALEVNTNTNRNYNTAGDYDYQRTGMGQSNMSSARMTRTDLEKQLTPASKAIFNNLGTDGQEMALDLASQDSYKDKNLAVKEAQRRINERRGAPSMTQGSNPYNR